LAFFDKVYMPFYIV